MEYPTPDPDPEFAEEPIPDQAIEDSMFETVVNPVRLLHGEYEPMGFYPTQEDRYPRRYVRLFNFAAGAVTGGLIVLLFHLFTKG